MKALNMVLGLSVTMAFIFSVNVHADQAGEDVCKYERHVWSNIKWGAAGADSQEKLKVLVLGQVRNGDSVWYSILTGPERPPELVPQGALAEIPEGTCAREGTVARTIRELKEGFKEEFGVGEFNNQKVTRNWPKDPGIAPAPLQRDLVAGSDSRTSAR